MKEKGQTIRDVLDACRKGQAEIEARLKTYTKRQPEVDKEKTEGRPARPNVLDEIINDLQELVLNQKDTIKWIESEINNKL